MKTILAKIWSVMHTPEGWIAAIMAYWLPLKDVYHLIIYVVAADFILGLIASHKHKIPRNSKRLRQSILKLFAYLGVVYLFYDFENACGVSDWVCSYKMITGFIFLVEIISILENIALITEQPVFLKIIRFIRGRAADGSNIVGDILDEKNDTDLKNLKKKYHVHKSKM